MKQKWSHIFACFVLAVFVNFMFSNVLFMHLHRDAAGHSFLHSHPYLPKAPHTHDSQSLDLIGAFNISAISTQGSETPTIHIPEQPVISLLSNNIEVVVAASVRTLALRGPPAK